MTGSSDTDEAPERAEEIMDATAVADLTEEDIAGRRKRRLEEKQYVTGRVGETCRYIGFGLVALFYAISISVDELPMQLLTDYGWWVRAFGALGALTVLADYLQYLAGDIAARAALNRTNDGAKTHLYSKKWLSYRARNWMYVAKQLLALLGASTLAGIMLVALFK
jgi:hypothetical protein